MGPKFQFPKKVFPTKLFIHKTCFTTFHIDISQKINKNFLDPTFQKILQVIVNFRKKCFRQIFLFTKHVSQPLWDQNFLKNFSSYCPPMGPNFQFPKKVFPTNFFTHKTCFTTFHID